MDHFIQRRGNQTRQANDVDIFLACGIQNRLGWHHHPKVNDFKVITLQHHTDDIFTDIMHIALDGGHQDFAVIFASITLFLGSFDEGHQISHGFFHHTGRLHHLRQKHLAFTEQITNHIHAVH